MTNIYRARERRREPIGRQCSAAFIPPHHTGKSKAGDKEICGLRRTVVQTLNRNKFGP
jgi:hypothetical protein